MPPPLFAHRSAGLVVPPYALSVLGADPGPAAVGPLLEHAPIAVLLTDATGALLGWNHRAEGLLDLDAAHRGHPIDQALPTASSLLPVAGSSGAETGQPELGSAVAGGACEQPRRRRAQRGEHADGAG